MYVCICLCKRRYEKAIFVGIAFESLPFFVRTYFLLLKFVSFISKTSEFNYFFQLVIIIIIRGFVQ